MTKTTNEYNYEQQLEENTELDSIYEEAFNDDIEFYSDTKFKNK